jgi:hypothetical protein
MKVGDRVRVVAGQEVDGYYSGDKGTVVHVGMTSLNVGDDSCYVVAMDKDAPHGLMGFTADEIEPDA